MTVMPDPPFSRMLELIQLAEKNGFRYAWTYDSHILWQEERPLSALAAAVPTSPDQARPLRDQPGHPRPHGHRRRLRDAARRQVTAGRRSASAAATRRGGWSAWTRFRWPSSRRRLEMIKAMMNGRPGALERQGPGARVGPRRTVFEIPMYVAGYGPRALSVAGRVGDGVVIQLADPEDQPGGSSTGPRPAAVEAGRDPDDFAPVAPRARGGRPRPTSTPLARGDALVSGDGVQPRQGPDRALRDRR